MVDRGWAAVPGVPQVAERSGQEYGSVIFRHSDSIQTRLPTVRERSNSGFPTLRHIFYGSLTRVRVYV